MSYASEKGRADTRPPTPDTFRRSDDPPALSEEGLSRAKANKAFVEAHMPEVAEELRYFVEIGYAVGWRDIQNCSLNNDTDPSGNTDRNPA